MKKYIFTLLAIFTLTACSGDKPHVVELDCFNNAAPYKLESGEMEFCYDTDWGQPAVENVNKDGQIAVEISFSNDPSPTLLYHSNDYDGLCFNCFNLVGSEDIVKPDLAEALSISESSFEYRKGDISGKRFARVEEQNTLTFYVPDAFNGNHLTISGSTEIAADLDDFVYTVIFR